MNELPGADEAFAGNLRMANFIVDNCLEAMENCPFETPEERIAAGAGLMMTMNAKPDLLQVMVAILMERILHVD